MRSALYHGIVEHARSDATRHAFSYRVCMTWLDLDELDVVFRGRWLWSARRRSLAWFKRSDYLGDPNVPLADAVKDRIHERCGFRPTGPVRMLTTLRAFGVAFNPVTFYYAYDASGEHVEAVVAEITNTPWNERHAYVFDARGRSDAAFTVRFKKDFHVSPFIDMDCDYEWTFAPPGESLDVAMRNLRGGNVVFFAALRARRVEIGTASLAGALLRFPAQPLRVLAAIYWQALRLWWKGAPFFVHPKKREPAGAGA